MILSLMLRLCVWHAVSTLEVDAIGVGRVVHFQVATLTTTTLDILASLALIRLIRLIRRTRVDRCHRRLCITDKWWAV